MCLDIISIHIFDLAAISDYASILSVDRIFQNLFLQKYVIFLRNIKIMYITQQWYKQH